MKQQRTAFPGQRPTEQEFIVARHHWVFDIAVLFRLAVTAALPLVLVPVAGLFGASLPREWRLILLFVYALYVALLLVIHLTIWLNAYLDFAIVTNERLIDFTQTSLVNQKISETPLSVIQDATGQVKGFWGTVLGYGDVLVQTAGEAANFHMKRVPMPNKLASRIMELRERYMSREGEALR